MRDKNNVPVSGVVVNFTSPNSGASALFSNGGHTLSLVTDSAGSAAVTGMQPVGTGSFQVSVTASVQGHVVATTTISQTNYLTAAAASSGATGGGGLSTGAIVGIVAAGAAVVIGIALGVAKKGGVGGGGSSATGTISGPGTVTVGGPH